VRSVNFVKNRVSKRVLATSNVERYFITCARVITTCFGKLVTAAVSSPEEVSEGTLPILKIWLTGFQRI
jgi:hypothetical protein